MANTAAPFGFKQVGTNAGPVNFASQNPNYRIVDTYATAIYFGDLVRLNVSGPSGYIEQWANGDGATATKIPVGIFYGCAYYSSVTRKTEWSNYWPGSGAPSGATIAAFVVTDPNAEFEVQAGGVAGITIANLGQTADISATPLGNSTTGISGMSLAAPTTTGTLPFKVTGLVTTPPGVNGTDTTTPYNRVLVSFNNQMFKNSLGV